MEENIFLNAILLHRTMGQSDPCSKETEQAVRRKAWLFETCFVDTTNCCMWKKTVPSSRSLWYLPQPPFPENFCQYHTLNHLPTHIQDLHVSSYVKGLGLQLAHEQDTGQYMGFTFAVHCQFSIHFATNRMTQWENSPALRTTHCKGEGSFALTSDVGDNSRHL